MQQTTVRTAAGTAPASTLAQTLNVTGTIDVVDRTAEGDYLPGLAVSSLGGFASQSVGGGDPHNNMQPSAAVRWCIRT